MEVWRYGVPELRCTIADVELWKYGAPELWERVVGVEV
jgi:hypothetical protein